MPSLEINVDKANMKNADDIYKNLNPIVSFKLGANEQKTTQKMHTLTPQWEETYTMEVTDPLKEELNVEVFLGEDNVGGGVLKLDKLVKGKPTYKGVAVKGGKLDLELKAVDFGEEAAADEKEDDSWADFL
eukprot:NODE_8414_length_551_cov_525.792453_g8391_i0.p2 GENE.NODE_8414_length_551_cov_525.792453_g8391_i0~~NODE_8414_length_551_cov_525.792453_g8391_i0.p2  ORF type:complete len:131 (-),score=54.67 NODE_8414_length_551_cov_525.792453_g8391_i0:81-473(-)